MVAMRGFHATQSTVSLRSHRITLSFRLPDIRVLGLCLFAVVGAECMDVIEFCTSSVVEAGGWPFVCY
jgi:hypothetical protein